MDQPEYSEGKPGRENHMRLPAMLALVSAVVILFWIAAYVFTQQPIIPLEIVTWFAGILSGVIVEVAFSAERRAELLQFLKELASGLDKPLRDTRKFAAETRELAKAMGSEIERTREQALQLRGDLEVLPPMAQQARALILVLQELDKEVMSVNERIVDLERRISEIGRSKFSFRQALVTVATETVSTVVLSQQIQALSSQLNELQKQLPTLGNRNEATGS